MAECPDRIERPARRLLRGAGIIALSWILVFPITAHSMGAAQPNRNLNPDYGLIQKDILRFELVLNNLISSVFSSNPFAVVQKPKGVYLPGYGISVSFLINIHRAVRNSPFGELRMRDLSPEAKKRRIEELKERLIQLLQNSGDDFHQLRKDDCVTIVAYVEDRNFPDEPNSNKTIVMVVLKKDLDEFGRKTDRLKEFKQRMKIVEY